MSVVALNESSQRGIGKLISSSHERPMDFASVLPWGQGVDLSKLPKPEDQGWFAGTPYAEALTPAQRLELLWKETGRDISMFIMLEQTIPPLYIGYINANTGKMADDVYEYMMLFSKEEIVHTLMFQQFMKLAGLKVFSPPDGLYDLLAVQLPKMPPEWGIAATLVIEWLAELAAMYASQGEGIEPMTKKMFYEHHVDEARHIAFGRWVTESYLQSAPEPAAQQLRGLLRGVMERLVPQFTYNPEIADHVSFAYPIARTDEARIAEVRNSAHNTALNEKRFAPLYSWLKKQGVM